MRRLGYAVALIGIGILLVGLGVWAQDKSEAPSPHLVINEIEINPPGMDTDHEWVELLNLTDEPIDLLGWLISYSYRDEGFLPMTDESLVIPAGGRYVFVYPGLRLRNGEAHAFQLLDPEGTIVDETAPFSDESDDDRTWQRFPDGGVDPWFPDLWLFQEDTRNKSNS
jgi:hypothetical protein